MDHGLELIIARLEILEIEVCNILQNPGNIDNTITSFCSDPGNIGKLIFSMFYYPGKIGKRSLHYSHDPGNLGNLIFVDVCDFTGKGRARRNVMQNRPKIMPRSLV